MRLSVSEISVHGAKLILTVFTLICTNVGKMGNVRSVPLTSTVSRRTLRKQLITRSFVILDSLRNCAPHALINLNYAANPIKIAET